MLSNEDLAELLESTRDRVSLIGGDAASAVGVVGVLNGLITMLRDEVASDAAGDEQPDFAARNSYVEPGSEPEPEPEPEPPRAVVPVRLRQQKEQQTKPANPLLSDQYAGFFSKLIADQKPQPQRREAGSEEADREQQAAPGLPAPPRQEAAPRQEAPARQDRRPQRPAAASTPPANSSVSPQYRGFFDALVRDQKGQATPAPADHEDEETDADGNGDTFTSPPPIEAPPPPQRSPGVWRDETSTG